MRRRGHPSQNGMMIIMPSADRPARFEDHPTVRALAGRAAPTAARLALEEVRRIALEAGADDAGAVSLDHPDLAEERPHVLRAMPTARSLVAIVLRTHLDDIRSPRRSIANLEFHRTGHELDEIARRIAVALSAKGWPTINPAMAFPMELDDFPGRGWVVSHKKVAVAAQLGRMGIHRSVIHPRFGSFVLLATVITSAEIDGTAEPLAFDPCVSCKLCVAACPVGAIEPNGGFRFSACYDHNYREFMTGFGDFMEEVADSRDRNDLRERVSISETASMWQSLAYKPNYKAAYCIAVCPAGEDVMGPFVRDRAGHLRDVVEPLTERVETVYVVPGSDAEAHVRKRFPHKQLRKVRSSLRPTSARAFFEAIPLTFQRGQARGWKGTFHFDLTGSPPVQATVRIDDGSLEIEKGHVGTPDVSIQADGQVWIDVVTKRRNPVLAVITGRLKVKGDRSLLGRFAACFPR
jgi:epoxyqueuosine reductase QueG/putative sterol carrier protein